MQKIDLQTTKVNYVNFHSENKLTKILPSIWNTIWTWFEGAHRADWKASLQYFSLDQNKVSWDDYF